MENKKAPLGVKIIAFLSFAGIAYSLIYPWLLPIMESVKFEFLQSFFEGSIGNISLALFLITLPLAILFFFITLDFAKGKNWARVFFIVIEILGFLLGLGNLFSLGGVLNFLFFGGVAAYLLFNKKVKKYFKKRKEESSEEDE